MKKKIETALWTVLALAALVALVIGVKALNSKYLMTARYLETGDGRPMIVYSGGCVLLTGKDGAFDSYADGDKIFVMTDPFEPGEPAETRVYLVFRMSKGDLSKIPEEQIAAARELGLYTD